MTDSQELPAPPRLIPALVAGFDAITNHILLICFPIVLDLWIWLAPHLRIKNLIETILAQVVLLSTGAESDLTNVMKAGQDVWLQLAERTNLAVFLRSYPVGVPSLMAATSPLESPLDSPWMFEIPTAGLAFFTMILLTSVGLILGTFYYLCVSQAAIRGAIQWKKALREWPRASLQVFLLALIWILLFIVVSIPVSCLVSVMALAGLPSTQLAILFYGGALIWIIFPLLFSPHGIFTGQMKAFASVRASIRMTNATLSTTVLFVAAVFLLNQGLDLLWQIPPENSWLTLLGIAGHAFVVTSLVSASFVYYQSAQRWIQQMDQKRQPVANVD